MLELRVDRLERRVGDPMPDADLDLVPVLAQCSCHALDWLELTADRPLKPALEVPPRRPRGLQIEDRHRGLLEIPRSRHPMHLLAEGIERLPRGASERCRMPHLSNFVPLCVDAFGAQPSMLTPPYHVRGVVQVLGDAKRVEHELLVRERRMQQRRLNVRRAHLQRHRLDGHQVLVRQRPDQYRFRLAYVRSSARYSTRRRLRSATTVTYSCRFGNDVSCTPACFTASAMRHSSPRPGAAAGFADTPRFAQTQHGERTGFKSRSRRVLCRWKVRAQPIRLLRCLPGRFYPHQSRRCR